MTTGDLSNNIRKLKAKLKQIKYQEDVDVNGLAEGTATVYLPVYHYAFTSYSPALAEQILGKDIELYGKSDARFMEAIYKVLRDFFTYKPPITKDQFFNRGFAERKVIMCTEILQLVKDKAMELNPAAAKTTLKTSVRPKSSDAPGMTKQTSAGNLGKRPPSSKSSSRIENQSAKETSPRLAPQVVNELKSETETRPVRHVATHSQQKSAIRHVARHSSGDSRHSKTESSLEEDSARPDVVRHVAIRSPPVEARYQVDELSPEHLKPVRLCLNTPSITRVCPESVEVVSMPKGTVSGQPDQSVIEINAPTSDSVLYGPVASSHDIQHQITSLYQALETLTGQVQKFDSSMKMIEQTVKAPGLAPDPYIQSLENKIQSQIDNLMARMVLVENRISIIETKVDMANSSASTLRSEIQNGHEAALGNTNLATGDAITSFLPQHTSATSVQPKNTATFIPIDEKGSSFATERKFLATLPKSHSALTDSTDMSLMFSPIRQTGGRGPTGQLMSANEETFALDPEEDARRSSTPAVNRTLTQTEHSTICCDVSDGETQDKVARIKSMIKETQGLLTSKQTASSTS